MSDAAIHGFWISAIPAEMTSCIDACPQLNKGDFKDFMQALIKHHPYQKNCEFYNNGIW